MACYARESCGYDGELITEVGSRSTWERLVPAADYRFGELTALRPVLAAIGRRHLRSAVRSAAAAGTAAVSGSAQTTLS